MKIIFIVPYPPKESPSQRFRFEQYYPILLKAGFELTTHSFLATSNWRVFYKSGNAISKILLLMNGFFNRLILLSKIKQYDFIFVHREATPIGFPFFEWLVSRLCKKKLIYDFDDSIWISDSLSEPPIKSFLKYRKKVGLICRWSHKVSCGNEFLFQYAQRFSKNCVINPTTIDTTDLHNPFIWEKKSSDLLKIGWTGSHSTNPYWLGLEKVLLEIEKTTNVSFVFISDTPVKSHLSRIEFISWNRATEIRDLLTIDIGIMPLPDNLWVQGKCGLKALQFMALEIPVIVSPIGVNRSIVEHGVSGFFAETDEDWRTYLLLLLQDNSLRKRIGVAGRQKVIDNYSVSSNSSNFLSLFE